VHPLGSGQGPVAGSCEYGDEPSGSGATVLVSWTTGLWIQMAKRNLCSE
jgi:hypothetical protein